MKKQTLILLFLIVSFPVFTQTNSPFFQDGKIWFKLSNEARINESITQDPYKIPVNSIPGLDRLTARYGITNLSKPFFAAQKSIELQRTYLVEFSNYTLADEFVRDIASIKNVDYAEKVPLDKTCLTPDDPDYSSQWHLDHIGAPGAWDYFSSGSNVVIAIIDDAVQRTHPDLSPNLWVNPIEIPANGIDEDGNGFIDDINGYDVASNDNNPNPPSPAFDHGTQVAGIASAGSDNSQGIASIGFSCKLMCIKATNTPGTIANGYDGIVYAVASGANVINMSWGGPGYSITAQNIVNYAWSEGCILVASAGNDNVNTPFYPAAYDHVISVAATNSNDTKSSFSNYGSWIDISAPGNNIYTTTVGSTYTNQSGTSMASPMVAGLIGLMWSLNPAATQTDLISCLQNNATNVDAENPGYIGQLGSGRINATNAMQCVSATLNNPPFANFTATYTTINAGGQVSFTDLSTYAPAVWNWSFPGGTPSSYIGQNPPPVVYNTPGTYNVSLTVSNANGADTEIYTNYINVNPPTGCYIFNLPAPGSWTPVNYLTGTPAGADGCVNGMNIYLDKEKAMYFDGSALPYTVLNNVWVAFGLAYTANPAKIVQVKIYDGTSGSPGALLGSQNTYMGQIMTDADNSYYTEISFVNNPVTLPASKRFFVSVDLTNLQWTPSIKDTLSIVSNANGQSTGFPIWEKQSDNIWYQYGSPSSWNLDASLYIHPFLTNANSQAVINTSSTTICQGNFINFNAIGSTYEDTLLWYFPGASPNMYSSSFSDSVMYNTPGTYQAILYTIGGGCHLFDSSYVNITVNASPFIAVSGNNEICNGQNTSLTASGASSYNWQPSTGLSGTTGPFVTANPTGTTTYNIEGTAANGCKSNTFIEIEVLNPPVSFIDIVDTILDCTTTTFWFDGNNSTDADNFVWNFPGGSPSSSSSTIDSINYVSPGAYTATLVTTNTCGTDTAAFNFNVADNALTTALFTASDTIIDCGDFISYNGSLSVNADSYVWDFSGGNPGSSSLSTETVTYDSAGTFLTQLITSNSCGRYDTTAYTLTVLDNCNAGIDENIANITGYYSYLMQGFVIESTEGLEAGTTAGLYNNLGQIIIAKKLIDKSYQLIIPVEGLSAGMYIIQLSSQNKLRSYKFITR